MCQGNERERIPHEKTSGRGLWRAVMADVRNGFPGRCRGAAKPKRLFSGNCRIFN